MGIETGTAIALAALLGTGAAVGTSIMQSQAQEKQAKAAREAAGRTQQGVGNLTEGEAKVSASRRAFRQGLFLTSPTGVGSGKRGRSRLIAG